MKLRVLHAIKERDSGGIQSVICNWYNNIDKEKVNSDFAIHLYGKREYIEVKWQKQEL